MSDIIAQVANMCLKSKRTVRSLFEQAAHVVFCMSFQLIPKLADLHLFLFLYHNFSVCLDRAPMLTTLWLSIPWGYTPSLGSCSCTCILLIVIYNEYRSLYMSTGHCI